MHPMLAQHAGSKGCAGQLKRQRQEGVGPEGTGRGGPGGGWGRPLLVLVLAPHLTGRLLLLLHHRVLLGAAAAQPEHGARKGRLHNTHKGQDSEGREAVY